MTIQDKVKTVEDACRETGKSVSDAYPFSSKPANDFQKAVNCFAQSLIVVEALNEGRVPDYDNNNEKKWELWWDMRGQAAGGSGFSLNSVYFHCSNSRVGARLVFLEEENAEYFAKQFPHLFEGWMVLKK